MSLKLLWNLLFSHNNIKSSFPNQDLQLDSFKQMNIALWWPIICLIISLLRNIWGISKFLLSPMRSTHLISICFNNCPIHVGWRAKSRFSWSKNMHIYILMVPDYTLKRLYWVLSFTLSQNGYYQSFNFCQPDKLKNEVVSISILFIERLNSSQADWPFHLLV